MWDIMGFLAIVNTYYLWILNKLTKFESKREHLSSLNLRKISQMNYKPGSVI